MANEVSHRHSATGETLYFTIRNTARQMWNTGGTPNFEALTVANWTSYDVALTETPYRRRRSLCRRAHRPRSGA